ncbi:hypothetical protein [Burkholderia ambifaria]|uniref:hypothetical protein n=1 Tax=Burkholderia ambifaria TaxID=152480 RepID=UPI00348BCA1A
MIQDARNDDRFHDNPRVTGPGHPLPRRQAARCAERPNRQHSRPRERSPAHSPGSAATIHRAVERRRAGRRRRADLARVTSALAQHNAADARGTAIRFSVGHAAYEPARHHPIAALLVSADRHRYEDKRGKAAGA